MCEYVLGIKKRKRKRKAWNGPFPSKRDVVMSSGQIKRERGSQVPAIAVPEPPYMSKTTVG